MRQFAFDDSHSPEYQKFKIDKPPRIVKHEVWHYYDYIPYIKERYGVDIKPVNRRKPCDIPDDTICPCYNAPKEYLYKNNGSKGQLFCKVCLGTQELNTICLFIVKFPLFRLVSLARRQPCCAFTHQKIKNFRELEVGEFKKREFFCKTRKKRRQSFVD